MTVFLSRSEIKSEVEKAVRGAGYDWGRAKDSGVMAAWLAAHDQVFLGVLLRGLDVLSTDIKDDAVFAPVDAMMAAEYVSASRQDWSGYVIGVRFMLAAMGIVSLEHRASLTLKDEHGIIAYAKHGEVWFSQTSDTGDRFMTLTNAEPSDIENAFTPYVRSHQTAHEVNESCWQRLGVLAHMVYVKETEEKRRSGAGAGDIDNT